MTRREFIALLGGALASAMAAAVRARAQQPLAPQHRSAPPSPPPAQVVPQPVPQVTPQLNVPGPQTVPSPPGNPVQQLSPLGGTNPEHASHPPPWCDAWPAPPPTAFRMSSGPRTKPTLAPALSSETICNHAAVQMLTTPEAGGAPNLIPC